MANIPVLTVAEYQEANNARRALHSELVQAEIEATRAALAKLKTARGRVELNRKAHSQATRYLKTAKLAQNIAGLAMIEKASIEDKELGRQRLLAATAEMYGETVEEVLKREPRPRGRPRTTKHGLQMYKSGRCKCDEICRPANAAAQQRYKENRAKREQS